MRFVIPLLIGVAGCGRANFDPIGAAVDGDSVDTPTCNLGAWSSARLQTTASSAATEFGPALTADGLTLFFESSRPGGSGGYDLWFATRATITDDFGLAINAGPVNSSNDDRGPTLTTDGLTLYFYTEVAGNARLRRAVRASTTELFGAAVIVPELGTTQVAGPAISPRGDELFFSQGTQIYRATFDGSTFQGVAPIAELNTGPSQGYASVSGDGLELYFETARGDGTKDDVWIARRPAIGAAFVTAAQVAELCSVGANDADPEVSRDGRTSLVASDRPGGLVVGGMDLYLFTRACL